MSYRFSRSIQRCAGDLRFGRRGRRSVITDGKWSGSVIKFHFVQPDKKLIRGGDETYCVCRYGGGGENNALNALQGNYSLARKTQAVEFNENGDIDTPGEYFSHPRWYHALITTLQDVDTLIYIHAANDKESRLPAGLLDIGASKRQIAVISKTDMPDADVAATRQLLRGIGFQEPIFELNSHDPRSVQHLVDYLTELSQKEERAGEKTHHS